MRRFVWTLLATLSMTSCTADDPLGPQAGSGDSQLAVLNALAATDGVRLEVDGVALVSPAPGATGSKALEPGAHRIEARSLSGGDVLASANFAVAAGGRISAVLSGATGKTVVLLVVTDTASLPPVGAAKVRLVHTVPKAPIYDSYLYPVGEQSDSNGRFVTPFMFATGSYPEFPGYAVRGPGTYRVWLKLTGQTAIALESAPFTMGAGQVYSVVLSENAAGTQELRIVRER